MSNPYFSKFEGGQFDQAVEIALNLKKMLPFIKIESTPDNKVDLNQLIIPNTYAMEYYINSYDDESGVSPINVSVMKIRDTLIEQTYFIEDRQVYRYYDIEATTWSDWKVSTAAIISIPESQPITVDTKTLVLRYKDGNAPAYPIGGGSIQEPDEDGLFEGDVRITEEPTNITQVTESSFMEVDDE